MTTPLKPFICGLAFMGLLLPLTQTASAADLSTGCTQWNGNSTFLVISPLSGSQVDFKAGEVASITVTDTGGGSTVTFTYNDVANSSPEILRSVTVASDATETANITVPQDTTGGQLLVTKLSGAITMTINCVAGAAPTPSAETQTPASTTSAVVAAVSRSQTSVVQQNIGARVSAISNAAGGTTGGGINGTPTGSDQTSLAGSNSTLSSFAYDHQDTAYTTDDSGTGLKQLAMMGDFDSSQSFGNNLFNLGPADQGGNSGIGGASGPDGRSALSTPSPFTVWGHGSYTNVDNDYANGTLDSRYNGDVWGYNIGLDYQFTQTATAGVSLGYNDTDLTTAFNNGTYDETGWVVSPYAIYSPFDGVNLVAEAGFGMGDIDVTRDNGAVRGNTDSDIWYGAVSASYRYRPLTDTPLSLSPSVALLAARKTVDGYTESDGSVVKASHSNTRQIKPAVEMAYDFYQGTMTLTPFIEAGMIHDFTDEVNNDATAFNLGGGVRLSDSQLGLNGALEGNYLAGRSDYSEYTLAGTITYGFALKDDQGRALGVVKPFFGSNLNEFGNQRLRGGLGYAYGDLTSELSLSHMMSIADKDHQNDTSSIEVSLSLPF